MSYMQHYCLRACTMSIYLSFTISLLDPLGSQIFPIATLTTVFHHCPYSFNNRMPSILSVCVTLCCTVLCKSIVGCTVNLVSMALRASLFGISLTVVFSVYVTPLQVLNGHMYFTFSIFKYTYKIPYLKPCEVHKSSTITIYFRTHDCISTEFAKFK